MSIRNVVLGLALAVVAATGSDAATVTFDFTGSNSGVQNSLTYSNQGVGLTITGAVYDDSFNANITGSANVGSYAGNGIGVTAPGDNSGQIDGRGSNDMAIFSFDRAVTLESVQFSSLANNQTEYFDFFSSDTGNPLKEVFDLIATASYSFNTPTTANNFGIGAYYSFSGYYISGLTVSYVATVPVPLPAGGLLLLGALGALRISRRRKV
ncbi:MAG: hypothetical protein WA822_18385 [Albidovulum sp.]